MLLLDVEWALSMFSLLLKVLQYTLLLLLFVIFASGGGDGAH